MSDSYIVSARKYRPQTFDTVVGQEHITTTLKNAIRNQHLAHAFLFCGPRGVGKTTCARILARTINCESPTPDMEACGTCSTCVSLRETASFNVFELDAASNNSVDDIRELTAQVRFAPQHGRYKVYIIDEVHMLSAAAFNAFLKTLEEPPPYAIFILATTEKHKILPTILSRCQIFDFKRITTGDIVAHLQGIAAKEGMIANEAALHVIAQKSEGCMRDALSMLDRIASFTNGMLTYANTMEHLNLLDAEYYFSITDTMLSQDVAGTLLHLDNALARGFEGDVIIGGLAEHFRNLLLCKDARMARLLDVPAEHKKLFYEKANQAPPSFIISALNVLNTAELEYKNATNRRLHIEMCLIRLCYLLQAVSGDSVSVNGSADEKKNTSRVVNEPTPAPYTAPVTTPTPAPQVAATPVAPPAAPPAPPMPQAAPMPTAADAPPPQRQAPQRKVSARLLEDVDTAAAMAASTLQQRPTRITQEQAVDFFNQYRQELQRAEKNVLYAQCTMMQVEVHGDDEVRIVSPAELTNTYALEQRLMLIEYFSGKAGLNIRVTTEVRIDESRMEPENKALSRNEIFDLMVSKNPALGHLRDALNLQIEY